MTRPPAIELTVVDAVQMAAAGAALAGVLQAGDAVCLTGPLGAGKTTLTRGLGSGLGVAGDVASPTFVIARRHRGPRIDLLHCDAYRLSGPSEVADLDLDPDDAVVVVEWGESVMAEITDTWLAVAIDRTSAGDGDARAIRVTGHGPGWGTTRMGEVAKALARWVA